ncbi:MAG TPA: glycosyltransferase [Gemmataceae bacterium]|jgi:glycosyltransferase involved in cell wall biosynthesis
MDTPILGMLEYVPTGALSWEEELGSPQMELRLAQASFPPLDAEALRRFAWEINEQKPAEAYAPTENHVGLAAVTPNQGFAQWRIRQQWVDETAKKRGGTWNNCRLVLRLYDVSLIQFNGFNAHRIQDETLNTICGQRFFHLPRPGTSQIAEVGFLLRNGEFIPAARSEAVPFARNCWSSNRDQSALYVDDRGRVEAAGNVWEQENYLRERRRPKLRRPLRIAAFSLTAGGDGIPESFIRELTLKQSAFGHEVHVFLPASGTSREPHVENGIHYHPLPIHVNGSPLETAQAFARAVEGHLKAAPPFDLLHHHEWITGLIAPRLRRPRILSLTSLEATRRNGTAPSPMSRAIEEAERSIARSVPCVLTPEWLRERAITELGMDGVRVRSFPMEGRLANEWEMPLDYGHVKAEIGVGPLERLILFIGPLEHSAGVDLLVESLPTVLRRTGNVRVAFIGSGSMHGHLEHCSHQLGVAHAVRLLGHREGLQVNRLVRAAEALVLPSRCRVPFDDAVVDLARKAGRPVLTTHSGPAHLVRHEENGLLTYDNPGSIVWAIDRVLSDPAHAERMGRNGRRNDGSMQNWSDVTRYYLDLCANCFPELTVTEM